MSELTLTNAEQDLINARRTEATAKAETKAAEEAARQAKIDEKAKRHNDKVISMIDALDKVDTNNITYQTTEGGPNKVFFLLNGREEQVLIETHRVMSGSGWRAREDGVKYKLGNEYNNRYLKNPKTVIKNIKALQEALAAKQARATASKDLSERALDALVKKYPEADVAFQKGYDYRGNRNRYSHSNYQPDHITVTTPNGTVEFTYSDDTPTPGINDEGVKFSIRARRPSSEIRDQITKLILG